jgi:cyclic pyranopterin phosphate synthase
VEVVARTVGKTGVEMEVLTGASVALLTVYDMAKSLDKAMVISDISLALKVGGAGGQYARLDGTAVAP